MPLMRMLLHLSAALAVGLLYTLWSARPLWSDVALLCVLAVAVRLTWQGWAVAAPPALRWPALAFGAAHALSAVFSTDPLTSWRVVIGLAAYALVFALAGNVLAAGVSRGTLYRALVLAAAPLLIGLAVVWVADGMQLVGYRVRYENANSHALLNLLLFPALLTGELRGLVWALSMGIVWLTGSRGGMVGLAAGLVTTGPATLRRHWALVAGLALTAALSLSPRLVTVPGDPAPHLDAFSSNGRADLWREAGKMWADSPWMGQGPNTYKAWWVASEVKARRGYVDFGHAHNLYLNMAAEVGVIGLAAGAWLLFVILRSLARRGSMSGSMWAWAALAATAALLAHSLADTPTTAPYLTMAWLALVRCGLHEPA